jgi:hypothetical protein
MLEEIISAIHKIFNPEKGGRLFLRNSRLSKNELHGVTFQKTIAAAALLTTLSLHNWNFVDRD